MPLTFPAHQAVVLPVKLAWPTRTDATAMCIGAAAPDLGYPLFGVDSHTLAGVVVFAVPFTLVACLVLRWRAALGVFANLPDLGPFRVRSYRVLTERRPGLATTLVCAAFGACSHVLWDAFTHADRWGSTWLGLDTVLFQVPGRGDFTWARVLQYSGHTVGSLVAVLLFLHIGRRRLLDRWYGTDQVAAARTVHLTIRDRLLFWATAGAATAALTAALVAAGGQGQFSVFLGASVGLLGAGCLPTTAGSPVPVPTAASQDDGSTL